MCLYWWGAWSEKGAELGVSGVSEGKKCEPRGGGGSSFRSGREAGEGRNSHDEGSLATEG